MKYFTRQCITTAACAVLLSSPAWAEEPEGPWSGKIAAGYLASSGNTDTTAYNFLAEGKYDKNRWHHTLSGLAIGGSQDNSGTSESYKGIYDVKYDLNDRTYVFGNLEYNKDRFSSYDKQVFETVGVGYRFIKNEKHELNGQIGIGATQSDFRDPKPTDPLPLDPRFGTSQNEIVYVLGGDYTWQISETASFVQKLGTKIGSDNTYTESNTELRASVLESLALVLSYTIKQNSDVPNGADKRDTYTAISLEYGF
jgi:putative salt-induced outer membrane protein